MSKYSPVIEETFLDYPSPEGNAIIVYFRGCEHHCKGCHSAILQQFCEYSESNQEILEKIIDYCKRADTNKLVFLGGDPLYTKNLELTSYLVNNLNKEYDICIFTGYDIEYVKNLNLKGIKYYKCGRFDISQQRKSGKTDNEYILASPNQNFYDGNYKQLSTNGVLKFKQ